MKRRNGVPSFLFYALYFVNAFYRTRLTGVRMDACRHESFTRAEKKMRW